MNCRALLLSRGELDIEYGQCDQLTMNERAYLGERSEIHRTAHYVLATFSL